MKKAILALAVLTGLYGCATVGNEKYNKSASNLEALADQYEFVVQESSKTQKAMDEILESAGDMTAYTAEVLKQIEETSKTLEEYRKIKENEK